MGLPSDDQLRAAIGNSGPGWDVPPPRSLEELDAVMELHGYDDGYCAAGCRMPCGCRWRVGWCGPSQAAWHELIHHRPPVEVAGYSRPDEWL
jgi:hypothetical protein